MSLLPAIFRRGEKVRPLGPAIKHPARRVLVQHAPGWSVDHNARVPVSVTYCVSAGVSAKELRETIVCAHRLPIVVFSGITS